MSRSGTFSSQCGPQYTACQGSARRALIGAEKAFWFGVAPFVLGAIVKSALGAAILKAMQATVRRAM